MKDRFKFRLWNKEAKEMLLVYSFDKNFIQATPDYVVPSIRRFNTNDCILMQCTGLNDINGQLIYEGDIVQLPDKTMAVIKWDDDEALFYADDNGKVRCFDDCEVFGNIYEDKELL